jgi:hypothetical protein
MSNALFKYSNGWGHLIMSIFFGGAGLALILLEPTNSTVQGIGVTLLLTVSGAWFIPGAAKQYAGQQQPTTGGGNTNGPTP